MVVPAVVAVVAYQFIVVPSTAITQAAARERVVSVACHTSSEPTHSASVVESTTQESGSPVQLVSVQLDGVPRAGVTSVGEVANTSDPEPVSSLIIPFNSSEVVAANCDSLPVTSALSAFKLEKFVLVCDLNRLAAIQSRRVVIEDIYYS